MICCLSENALSSEITFIFFFKNFQIVRPVSALLVIDVQNDFISGSLAITGCPAGQDGEEVGHFLLNKIFE